MMIKGYLVVRFKTFL